MSKISFKPISGDEKRIGLGVLEDSLKYHPDKEEAMNILFGFSDASEDCGEECYAALSHDFVTCRFYDGARYIFTFPFPFSDGASEDGCKTVLKELAEYAVEELVPLFISDIPRDNLDLFSSVFPSVKAACYADEEDLFSALVLNECLELEAIPVFCEGDIALKEIRDVDAGEYYRLCTDPSVTKYWGYDAAADRPEANGKELLAEALSEFDRGVAIVLGIYKSGVFVGDAEIYGFDYFGGARIGVRLLPEYQGKGIGSAALKLLIDGTGKMGLKELRTQVMKDNVGSVKMTSKFMEKISESRHAVQFYLSL